MDKEDYFKEVEGDAFEYLRYHKNDVSEGIAEDLEFGSLRGGNGCDDISEHVAERDYSLTEAAEVMEFCTNEETDSSLWADRSDIRGMVSACAMRSYINDVAEEVENLYNELRDDYEVKFEVVTQSGEVVSDSFEDELEAEDFIEEHDKTGDAGVSVREVSNLDEIWQEFIDDHTATEEE